MMHLRQPILLPKEEPLRALIHARFSTEEQRQSSIDDQVASCRTFLESNLPKGWKPEQVEIDVIAEPEVSGEIADRPGINQVWAGIEAKRWHLIIAEESSRLYRHHTKAGELFESAVDADVRVICTSDYIDTADDDWPDRLHDAARPLELLHPEADRASPRRLVGPWCRRRQHGDRLQASTDPAGDGDRTR
jgi:hypothetical protein